MKQHLFMLSLLLAAIVVLSVVAYLVYGGFNSTYLPKSNQTTANTSSNKRANAQTVSSDKIVHIFVVLEENQPSGTIVGNSAAPYINSLISQYALATNYSAVTHPSLPNYLALTSGSTDGTTTDCNPPSAGCIINVSNIADQIESIGYSWKEYAESMPSNCYSLNSGQYVTKHNPFIYYQDIIGNLKRCDSHVVPFTQLSTDLKSVSTTPNFAFITPNLCNDMHDCSIATGDSWLAQNVPAILNSAAFKSQPSLLVITWDEGTISNNNVVAIFAGSAAKNGYKTNLAFTHYSLVRTIEYEWGLKPITAKVSQAPLMTALIKS